MKHQQHAIMSLSGFFLVGISVIGLAAVFFFGSATRGIVLGDAVSATDGISLDTTQNVTPGTLTSARDTISPSKPTNVRAVVNDAGGVSISWAASSDAVGVTGYALYRNGSILKTLTGTSFTDTGVRVGTSYEYAVLAGDAAGNKSDKSASVTVNIPAVETTAARTTTEATPAPTATSVTSSVSLTNTGDTTAPSRPKNVSVTIIDSRTVRIAWSVSSDTAGIVGYRLFKDGNFFTQVKETNYTDKSIYGGQTYRYSVEAVDTTGNISSMSDEKQVTVPLVTVQTGSKTTDTTWTAENNGNTLVVKNSSGEIVSGQTIASPVSSENTTVVMNDATKVTTAKNVIESAVRSGVIAPDTSAVTADTSTPDQLARLPDAQSLDFDNDGLSNADELRLGTDPYNPDTDHDGFSDGDEVRSGHDPLHFSPGDGRDKIVVEDVKNVLPKNTPDVNQSVSPANVNVKKDDRYRVKAVELVKAPTSEAKDMVRLSGTALPNAMVTLYIYSTPMIVTVKADAAGNWSYDVNQDLENGTHEAFVAVTDTTGKVTSYGDGIGFVKTADAITVRPIAEAAQTVSENQSPLERSQMEYFFAAFIAILFFSGAALIVVSRKSTLS